MSKLNINWRDNPFKPFNTLIKLVWSAEAKFSFLLPTNIDKWSAMEYFPNTNIISPPSNPLSPPGEAYTQYFDIFVWSIKAFKLKRSLKSIEQIHRILFINSFLHFERKNFVIMPVILTARDKQTQSRLRRKRRFSFFEIFRSRKYLKHDKRNELNGRDEFWYFIKRFFFFYLPFSSLFYGEPKIIYFLSRYLHYRRGIRESI